MKSKAAKAKSNSTSKGNSAARLAKARVGSAARAKPGNPLLARWGAAFGLPPFKKIDPAALQGGVCRGTEGAQGGDRGHRRRHGQADVQQHHRGAGEERPAAR